MVAKKQFRQSGFRKPIRGSVRYPEVLLGQLEHLRSRTRLEKVHSKCEKPFMEGAADPWNTKSTPCLIGALLMPVFRGCLGMRRIENV